MTKSKSTKSRAAAAEPTKRKSSETSNEAPQNRVPKLVIMGRPNVGKSTLFNRLFGRRRALVHDLPGVTRDRLEERARWTIQGNDRYIDLVDTGGLGGDKFAEEIERQVQLALGQADVVVVLFDGQAGLTPGDEQVLLDLQRSGLLARGTPIIGAVNKVDAESHEARLHDFYETGLDPLITISAEHGRGIDDLQNLIFSLIPSDMASTASDAVVNYEQEVADRLARRMAQHAPKVEVDLSNLSEDEVVDEFGDKLDEALDAEPEQWRPDMPPKIAIVGRPNVGKSTLVNAIVGEERMIASPIAGTTVDAVDSAAQIDGVDVIMIDTAGIRRKSKTEQGVEVLSVVQARKALERCDVAVLLLDGEAGIMDQDEKIGGLIEEVGCGVVLIVNKWDLQRNNPKFTQAAAAEILRERMAYLRYAPILFTSAKRGTGFDGLGDLVEEILRQRRVKVTTREFSEWVKKEAEIHNPMNAKFYLCHQAGKNPPTFVCHVSDPKKIHFSLSRHLVNAIRARWGFMGSPVRLLFVESKGRAALRPSKRPSKRGNR